MTPRPPTSTLFPYTTLFRSANNTSLAPLDLGDGPAGTRAAGFNIVNAERIRKPSRLHSKQQIRTANYVLQTSDPGGRSEEHTSELQSHSDLVCRLLLEKKTK